MEMETRADKSRELCRLCMVSSDCLIDVISSGVSPSLSDKINFCLHLKIAEEDKAPKKICSDCFNQIDLFYKFHLSVKEVQKKWDDLVRNDKNVEPRMENELHPTQKVTPVEGKKRNYTKRASKVDVESALSSCEICQKEFKSVSKLLFHLASHEKKYLCSVCDYGSVSSSNFKIHMMKHNRTFKYNCQECSKGFYSRSLFNEHILIKHSNEIVAHPCPTCKKTFQSNSYLNSHLKTHQKQIYQCDTCGKTYFSPKSIRRHILTTHEGAVYKCDFCEKEVGSLQSLKNHRRIHTGEKSYVCDTCGKCFCTRNNLVVHKRVHTGDKPYSCDTCNKSFSQISTLKVHKRYHTGERPYLCSFCSKCFVTLTLKKNHEKTHKVTI